MIWSSFTPGALSLRQAVLRLLSLTYSSLFSSTLVFFFYTASETLQRERDAVIFTICILLLSTCSAVAHT